MPLELKYPPLSTLTITITNFPFTQSRAFGISLGKTPSKILSPDGDLVYEYESAKAKSHPYLTSPLYQSKDDRGRLVGITNEPVGSTGAYYLATFNPDGNMIGKTAFPPEYNKGSMVYDAYGYISDEGGEQKIFSLTSSARNILSILFATFLLVFADSVMAEEIKSQSENTKKSARSEVKKEVTDPDLKLSIEELKKKYPISLLDEKNRLYKPGQKINIDDYSNEEIKAVFLNADRNFIGRDIVRDTNGRNYENSSRVTKYFPSRYSSEYYEKIDVHNYHELLVIQEACKSFGVDSDQLSISSDRKILSKFILSSEVIRFVIPFLPKVIKEHLLEEDRD